MFDTSKVLLLGLRAAVELGTLWQLLAAIAIVSGIATSPWLSGPHQVVGMTPSVCNSTNSINYVPLTSSPMYECNGFQNCMQDICREWKPTAGVRMIGISPLNTSYKDSGVCVDSVGNFFDRAVVDLFTVWSFVFTILAAIAIALYSYCIEYRRIKLAEERSKYPPLTSLDYRHPSRDDLSFDGFFHCSCYRNLFMASRVPSFCVVLMWIAALASRYAPNGSPTLPSLALDIWANVWMLIIWSSSILIGWVDARSYVGY